MIPSSVAKSESEIDATHEVAAFEATFPYNQFMEGMVAMGLIPPGLEGLDKDPRQAVDLQLIRLTAANSIARPKESPVIVDFTAKVA